MNWNSTEFVWLDWTVLAIGVIGVIWAVWHAIVKDRKAHVLLSVLDQTSSPPINSPFLHVILLYPK